MNRDPDAIAASARSPLPFADLATLGFAMLLPLVFAQQALSSFFSPKAALLLVALVPGLVVLAGLCARRDRAAWCAAAFVSVAAVATVLADVPLMALLGSYSWGSGLIFAAVLAGTWALGRRLEPRSRHALVGVLVVAAVLNALLGWVQMVVDLGSNPLRPYEGRALGLLGNPVHLGAFCAAAAWLALDRWREHGRNAWVWTGAVGVLAGAVQLSGSRVALGSLVIAAVVQCLRCGARRGSMATAVLLAGIVLALLVPAPSGSASTQRVTAAASSGLGPRLSIWGDAVEALTERPLVGYGPGRFFVAVSPRTGLEVVRYNGADALYADAHNVLVEYLTTTGIAGFALFAAWLGLAGARARGPLVGFVLVVAASMLFEPLYVGLTPLVMLTLGASGPGPGPGTLRPSVRAIGRVVAVIGALTGLVAGVSLLLGDVALERASDRRSRAEIHRAASLLPPWPDVPAFEASIDATLRALTGDRSFEERAIAHERLAVDRDPADPVWWARLGEFQEASRHFADADRSYRQALRRNPWSIIALSGRYRLAVRRNDLVTARAIRSRLCEIGKDACPPTPERHRRELSR